MTDDERRALGQTRRFAFQNLANGVPEPKICEDLRLSATELDQARRFVARKITDTLAFNRQPPIACANLREIRWNRKALLGVLSTISDMALSTSVILWRDKKTGERRQTSLRVTTQAIDHPEMIEGATRRMKESQR